MRVLVTGGAGRLGISVCRMLQKKGFEVRVFDLNSERNRKSVKELGSKADVLWGDITDADSVRQGVEGVDAVIHMAGILPPVTEVNPGLAAKVKEQHPLILAGGLTMANIQEAIACVSPDAVDVNSGIEKRPGKKDPVLMKNLMKKIKKISS